MPIWKQKADKCSIKLTTVEAETLSPLPRITVHGKSMGINKVQCIHVRDVGMGKIVRIMTNHRRRPSGGVSSKGFREESVEP